MMRESVHGCSFHVIMVMWLTSFAVCACIWYELKPCVASAAAAAHIIAVVPVEKLDQWTVPSCLHLDIHVDQFSHVHGHAAV